MKQASKIKTQVLLPMQLKDNDDLDNNAYIDCAGAAEVSVLIVTGTIDAALGSTAETTAPYLEECDTTDGTYTSFECELDAAIAATKDDKLYRLNVDRSNGGRKRYLRVNAPHAGDGTTGVNACIIAELFGLEVEPVTDTERGLDDSAGV